MVLSQNLTGIQQKSAVDSKKLGVDLKKSGVKTAVGVHFGSGTLPSPIFLAKSAQNGTKIGPKFAKNRPKIKQIPMPKPTSNSIPFLNRFLRKF